MAKEEYHSWKVEHPWWWMDGQYFYFEYTGDEARAYAVNELDGSLYLS